MLSSDVINMLTSDLAKMFTSYLANMFTSLSANIFTSDLVNMFTSELEKCKKNDLANKFPSEVGWLICWPCTRNTTLDPFGVVLIKFKKHTRAVLGNAKKYGAWLTSMPTRAIHLELAGELSTDSFIQALWRYLSMRSHPKEICSNNGTKFVGAKREIKEALRQLQ